MGVLVGRTTCRTGLRELEPRHRAALGFAVKTEVDWPVTETGRAGCRWKVRIGMYPTRYL